MRRLTQTPLGSLLCAVDSRKLSDLSSEIEHVSNSFWASIGSEGSLMGRRVLK